MKLIRDIDWDEVTDQFRTSTPFNHVAIDNFFLPEIADKISSEFPDFDDSSLWHYKNPLENKKVLNHWDRFPPFTYSAFMYLGREEFLTNIRKMVGVEELWLDYGLNGGGWHMHGPGGNLNVHLDYNIHPKLGEQRKLNIIIYMTKDWNNDWGGGLELWTDENGHPKECSKLVHNVFNRAVIFDTTQNSWHGLPKYLKCPEGVHRKSLAAYYVITAPEKSDPRGRALFAPREEQKGDDSIQELINKRSDVETSPKVYRT